MKIGLLSDTHGWLDPKIFDHFEKCDEVWHAGDIGNPELLPTFDRFNYFKAVHGNIDDRTIRKKYPDFQEFQCEQVHVWLTHIAGAPPLYTPHIQAKLRQAQPDILVCGHTHILRVIHDKKHPPLLYLNPGAAGRHGVHHMRTLLRFEINDKKIHNIEVIELGARAALVDNH
ncbi:metallophosphoesterase family protein [Cardinium endosymbiont of Oedothorax gibbosus]|uniref:metallophosphoesterase family protein n=1 Tax=Cardinium endosymbiont of Oedothorax gibbosus TaxID=931101 RepID=UPI0020259462|nr:metallophosphoesterase family protein [Cardinium endosymbiont of Oedothorax gibbosus]CAH2560152.1 Phosphodiesterase MJ0936/Vps29 family protein [Cardinium endosymbiont of Oedothorax gibbosus]